MVNYFLIEIYLFDCEFRLQEFLELLEFRILVYNSDSKFHSFVLLLFLSVSVFFSIFLFVHVCVHVLKLL